VAKPDVFARVDNDLSLGHTYLAIRRLRAYLGSNPNDLAARRLLAAVYRQTGNLVEAGRWGFLTEEVHPAEVIAFERANPSPWLRLRLLRFEGKPKMLPPAAQDRLRVLTVQAERVGPPAIWTGPDHPEPRRRQRNALPCLFVVVALSAFAALVAIGVYRAVMFIINY
jgi:Family of unknown function (DUF6584)